MTCRSCYPFSEGSCLQKIVRGRRARRLMRADHGGEDVERRHGAVDRGAEAQARVRILDAQHALLVQLAHTARHVGDQAHQVRPRILVEPVVAAQAGDKVVVGQGRLLHHARDRDRFLAVDERRGVESLVHRLRLGEARRDAGRRADCLAVVVVIAAGDERQRECEAAQQGERDQSGKDPRSSLAQLSLGGADLGIHAVAPFGRLSSYCVRFHCLIRRAIVFT